MAKGVATERARTVEETIESFLLSCRVEGKSYGTIECYTDKLRGVVCCRSRPASRHPYQ